MTVTKSLRFFSEELFYKSHRKLFSCVCIAWYKHSRDWENSGQLCKPSTSSLVSITVWNSPNPSRVYIRLCKHEKRFLLLKYYLVSHTNNNLSFPFPYGQTLNCNELLVPGGRVLPYNTYTGMCRPTGSWFWSSWFRTGYPFQRRFLARTGYNFSNARKLQFCKQPFEIIRGQIAFKNTVRCVNKQTVVPLLHPVF